MAVRAVPEAVVVMRDVTWGHSPLTAGRHIS